MRERGPGVIRAATLLTGLTALSQVLGLGRDIAIAAVLGAAAATDTYLYAQGVLNLVLAVFALPAVRVIVPPMARAAAAGDDRGANRILHSISTATVLITLLASAAAFLGAEQVVAVLAPGFDQDTAVTAARLTRILMAATVFVALTDLCAAAAQAAGQFLWSGLQGVVFNLVMITAVLGLAVRWGADALAIGFVVGSVLRFVVQLPGLRRGKLRLRPRWHRRDPGVAEAMGLLPALLITTAVTNVNTLVDRAVGSLHGEGVITALSYGWRMVRLVDALLVVTVAAAIYPALSSRNEPDQIRSLLSRALRLMVLLITPVTVLLVVAAEPVIAILFGHGAFDAVATSQTATAMAWYAICAVALAVRVILTRTVLALGDRRTTIEAALITMVINVVGDLTAGVAYGIIGLAASTSVSMLAGIGWLLLMLQVRHRALPPEIAPAFLRIAAAGVAAAVMGTAVGRLVSGSADGMATSDGVGQIVLQLLISAAVVGLCYSIVLALLRTRELGELTRLIRDRLPRIRAR